MSNWSLRAGSVFVTLSIFALWQVVTASSLVQPIFLPSPSSTFTNLWVSSEPVAEPMHIDEPSKL